MIFDLAIIGGGPAGYTAALEAEKEGLKVILFEKEKLGGVCLNKGCIPMKSFLYASEIYHKSQYWKYCSLLFPLETIIEYSKKNIEKLEENLKYTLNKELINIKMEEVNSVQKKEIYEIETNCSFYSAKNIIVAAGAKDYIPEINGLADALERGMAITCSEIFVREELPSNIIIIGAGFVGMEIASFLKDIGRNITVIEKADSPFQMLDQDIVSFYIRQMKRRGIEFIFGSDIESINSEEKTITYINKSEEKVLQTDLLVIATGKRVDNQWRNIEGAYICGDINGKSMLAHTAMQEAKLAVKKILGEKNEIVYENIPSVIYSAPEMAWVGKNHNVCLNEFGDKFEIIKIDMNYSSRYVIQSLNSRGILKVLIDKESEKILGCQIVGNGASELISVFSILISNQLSIKEIKNTVFPHPSIAEVLAYIDTCKTSLH